MTATAKAATVTIRAEFGVSEADLMLAITSGMIGGPHGYAYWCNEVTPGRKEIPKGGADEYTDEYVARNVLAEGTARFKIEDGSNATLTRGKLLKGFARWVIEGNARGAYDEQTNTIEFDIDAPASDLIMQYALFGKQVYG